MMSAMRRFLCLRMGAPPHLETASRPTSHFLACNLSTFGQFYAKSRPTGNNTFVCAQALQDYCEIKNESTDLLIYGYTVNGTASIDIRPRHSRSCGMLPQGSCEMRRWRESCKDQGGAWSKGLSLQSWSDQGGIPRLPIDHSDRCIQPAFVIICGSYYLGGNSPEQFRRTDTPSLSQAKAPEKRSCCSDVQQELMMVQGATDVV
jgi:hypothetical protein